MYDYLRYYIEGVTPEMCQETCSIRSQSLKGISTYNSYFCYCWYENGKLPSPLPSDVHAYSASHQGSGEVTLTLNEQDGDCYKFVENFVDTETPTNTPTDSPTPSPTMAPTKKPTKRPTLKPVRFNFVIGIALAQRSQFQFSLTKFVMLCIHTDTRTTCK